MAEKTDRTKLLPLEQPGHIHPRLFRYIFLTNYLLPLGMAGHHGHPVAIVILHGGGESLVIFIGQLNHFFEFG